MIRSAFGVVAAAGCLLSTSTLALSKNFVFEASDYYCRKLKGSTGSDGCSAPYRPFKGNACSVYNSAPEHDPSQDNIAEGSCTSESIGAAKRKTLKLRADLMGYVSLGNDETVNDPVVHPELRPVQDGSRPYWPLMNYFANECAVQTCSSAALDQDASESTDGVSQSNESNTAEVPKKKARIPKDPLLPLKICNLTNERVNLALARRLDPTLNFQMTGWWRIEARQCRDFGDRPSQSLHIFASSKSRNWPPQDRNGATKENALVLCTPNEKFSRTADVTDFGAKGCEPGMIPRAYDGIFSLGPVNKVDLQ